MLTASASISALLVGGSLARELPATLEVLRARSIEPRCASKQAAREAASGATPSTRLRAFAERRGRGDPVEPPTAIDTGRFDRRVIAGTFAETTRGAVARSRGEGHGAHADR